MIGREFPIGHTNFFTGRQKRNEARVEAADEARRLRARRLAMQRHQTHARLLRRRPKYGGPQWSRKGNERMYADAAWYDDEPIYFSDDEGALPLMG